MKTIKIEEKMNNLEERRIKVGFQTTIILTEN